MSQHRKCEQTFIWATVENEHEARCSVYNSTIPTPTNDVLSVFWRRNSNHPLLFIFAIVIPSKPPIHASTALTEPFKIVGSNRGDANFSENVSEACRLHLHGMSVVNVCNSAAVLCMNAILLFVQKK